MFLLSGYFIFLLFWHLALLKEFLNVCSGDDWALLDDELTDKDFHDLDDTDPLSLECDEGVNSDKIKLKARNNNRAAAVVSKMMWQYKN